MDTPAAYFQTRVPQAALQAYVSHYWLSRHNSDEHHTVLPDGAVDLVLEIDARGSRAFVYGTTTTPHQQALRTGSHYLGVRFRPGQGRHFLRATAAELTDTHEAAAGLLALDLQDVPQRLADGDAVFSRLDALLAQHLHLHAPVSTALDAAIRAIERSHGVLPVTTAAALQGKSLRQFERDFRETVGVAPKLFGRIQRFQQARALLSRRWSPAEIAADLGYTDQSHMSHEFRRFAGCTPAAHARRSVDFLQDR